LRNRFGICRGASLLLGGVALALGTPAQAQSSTETYTYDALGRLVVAKTGGGTNHNETHSICFDKSGNRTQYESTSDGTSAACVEIGANYGGEAEPEAPPPPPPPPPVNSPPATQSDLASGECSQTATVNLTANDTDAEGHYPLTLTAISPGSGGFASATIVSGSSASVTFGPASDITSFSYTVADSLGAAATGQLSATTSGCGGGPPPA